MEPEFADLSAVVLMLTPENRPVDFLRIASLYREEAALWTKKEGGEFVRPRPLLLYRSVSRGS